MNGKLDSSHGGTATRRHRDMRVLNPLADRVLDSAFEIHKAIGPGLLESVYEKILVRDLTDNRLYVERQKPISLDFNGMRFENVGYADLVVDNCLTVEIKSVAQLAPVHTKQLLTYLRLQDHRLGLLLNFGAPYMKDGVKRVINGY